VFESYIHVGSSFGAGFNSKLRQTLHSISVASLMQMLRTALSWDKMILISVQTLRWPLMRQVMLMTQH
jgi:hypothetical protein